MPQLNVFLYWLIIAGVIAGQSLLALWAATSERPRLVRALAVWVWVVLLMLVDARVPALLLSMTAAMTWAIVALVQRWTGPKPAGWHFQLADLFIGLLFVATIIALCRDSPPTWSFRILAILPLLGVPLAPVIAFAHLWVTGPARPRMAMATILAFLVSAYSLLAWNLGQALHIGFLIRLMNTQRSSAHLHLLLLTVLFSCALIVHWSARRLWPRTPTIARANRIGYSVALALSSGIAILLVARYVDEFWFIGVPELKQELIVIGVHAGPICAVAALVAAATWLGRRDWGQVSLSRRLLVRRVAVAATGLLFIPAAWLYWQMLWPTPFPPPPAGPTNYYRILEIAKQRGPGMQGFGALNRETLAIADELVLLLKQPNHLPTQALEDEVHFYQNRSKVFDGLDVRALQGLLTAAEDDARTGDQFDLAADYAIAKFRFGEMFVRGGTATHYNLATSGSLAKHRNKVSTLKAKEIVALIERSLVEGEGPEVLYRRSMVDHERKFGWQGRLKMVMARFGPPTDDSRWSEHVLPAQANLRAVQWLYAIRLFQEEHRRLPKNLAELSPEFLPKPPADPLTDQPLLYVPKIIDYKLYSVGPNGINNAGAGDDIDLSFAEDQY